MAIEFGRKRPVDFVDALKRLPLLDDPRIGQDGSIHRLSKMRDFLQNVLKNYKLIEKIEDLNHRISIPLEVEDISLMEEWTLRRIKSAPPHTYNFSWSRISNPREFDDEEDTGKWQGFFGIVDYEYYRWQICRLTPALPSEFPYSVVSVEIEGDLRPFQKDIQSKFHICMLTTSELNSLVETLDKNAY